MKKMSLGLEEALRLTLENIQPLAAENIALADSEGRIAASDLHALVDSPAIDTSRKDGFAVISREVAQATAANPVRLRLLGSMAAGGNNDFQVTPGTTVRVLTGARIPTGADSVVSEEFVQLAGSEVLVEKFSGPGRNIRWRGSDVALHEYILQANQQITPGVAGLLAAAGYSTVPVFKNPVVGIIGTGDELVEPGRPLTEGGVYASNIITLAGFCHKYQMQTRLAIAGDNYKDIYNTLQLMVGKTDAVLTSGGAWTGERDLMAQVLAELGWQEVFHRIRMGPGKAVGFGLLDRKPVFILSGGPSSNLMGYLQIALPGLLALSGHANPGLPRIKARLAVDLKGEPDWTDLFYGILEHAGDGLPVFNPIGKHAPVTDIAKATAIASITEGQEHLKADAVIDVQLLR
ncbi:Molybdopterin molybdenumtransferase [Sporotomaculum syntrophicum]|uniref:Molybdopterin molybdenumtransferase n=1 Tax=Sporotomaculum syntrophicum TaxID=182264 RepID=A0A9D3AYR9_9FIRM|nr:gephyrin-like molybdotransferase Glp [Sporotomaculum syntrophicum]KAF1085094.1 Molybdopterin molybdenumtransferase [Sporotomaculum syntrophicum]